MQFCFADLEQQIINSPSKQGDGRTFQEKIVNAYYVIDSKLEMNTFIFLNVIILTKKRKQSLLNYFIYRHNVIKFSELMSSKRKPILKKLCHFISAMNTGVCPPGSFSCVTSLLICIYIVNSCCYYDFIVISLFHCNTLA